LKKSGRNSSWNFRVHLIPLLLFPLLVSAQSHPSANSSTNGKSFSEGSAALQRGDFVAAQASFEAAVRQNPRDAQARNALGFVLLSQNYAAKAIPQFEAAVRLKPSFVNAHVNLSTALLRTHDLQGAIREANAAIRLAPNEPDAHLALARALEASSNINDSIASIRRALALAPSRADLHDDLGSMLVRQNDFLSATSEFQEALRLNPRLATTHFHLGVLQFEKKDFESAENHLTQATLTLAELAANLAIFRTPSPHSRPLSSSSLRSLKFWIYLVKRCNALEIPPMLPLLFANCSGYSHKTPRRKITWVSRCFSWATAMAPLSLFARRSKSAPPTSATRPISARHIYKKQIMQQRRLNFGKRS